MKAKHKRYAIFAGTLLASVLLACLASVQAGATESADDHTLSDLLNLKITGSTLREETLATVPSSVTVFSGEEIRRMGITDMESLMNYVPGFQSFRQDYSSVAYSYSARGRRVGSISREVLVLVDGQRMSNVFASGSAYMTPLISMENVKRVEFIRGPGSALYGSNAFLGVVNIITDKSLNDVEVAAGSFDGARAHVNYSYAGDELETALFVKYFQDGGEKYEDIYDTINQRLDDSRDPRKGFDLYLTAEYKGLAFNLSHIRRRNEQFYEAGYFSDSFNEQSRENTYANLSYAWNWLKRIDSVFRIGCRHSLRDVQLVGMPAGALTSISAPPGAEPLLVKAPVEELEPVIKLHNTVYITDSQDLQFGMEYRRPEVTEITWSNNYDLRDLSNGDFPIRYYGELRRTTPAGKERARSVFGLYGQYQFSPWESLTATAGLRYDHYDDFGSTTNPRLALVYRPLEKTALKLLYGEAFRAPTFNETDVMNNPYAIGNPDLKPEKVKTYEFIWMQQFARANFAMGYFDAQMTDNVILVLTDGSASTYANSGKEVSRGFELEISAEPADNVLLRGTFTHFIETPDNSFQESGNMASLVANYRLDKWNFNLSGNWQDEKQFQYESADGPEMRDLDSFVTVNAKFQYEVVFGATLFVQADNLFDKNYYTPPEEDNNPLGVPNRGRRFEMGVNWAF
jgi:iron complex outermembrane receptor protein